MKDISGREDVEFLINEFYNKVREDAVIGYIFTDVAKLNWDKHLPIMYNFWENVLFGSGDYKGNPMIKHIDLNRKETLKPEHFERWKQLWSETVQMSFQGPKSEEAIQRAHSIAGLMLLKVQQSKMN